MPATPPEFSHTELAFQLVMRHGSNFRYVRDTGEFLFWNGFNWESDPKATRIAQFVTPICCEAAERVPSGAKSESLRRTLGSHGTQQAVIKVAATDPRVIVEHKQLDADPYLLATPGGTVDLRTGQLRPPNRADLITMATSVTPNPGVPHPLFDDFLSSTFPLIPGNPEPDSLMLDFLQRWCGYSATGSTKWHHFVFFTGRGRNGKGVLFEAIRGCLGDYATVISSETLMERGNEPHRAELAVLRGKRLVMTSEITAGKWWNESRLNGLVAGDPITANFMRENPFTFQPVLKLWVAANTRPRFRSVDTKNIERLLLVQMKMRFLSYTEGHEDEEDVRPQRDDLTESLTPERPAILQWIIDGAKAALQSGLQIPQLVRASTGDYMDAEDELSAFIRTDCMLLKRGEDGSLPAGDFLRDLLDVWNMRRREDGESDHTRRQFHKELETRFDIRHTNTGTRVFGLVLNDIARAKLIRARDDDSGGWQGAAHN